MKHLNIAQKTAVTHGEGPLLILAGAGTGKTRVLTERIVYIINSYMATPHQILAVTFTNKAAAEMKERIAQTIGDEVNNVWCGTFHSIGNRILRRHSEMVGLKQDFTIIDSDDQLRLVKQITSELDIDNKEFPAKNYLFKICEFKDKALKPADLKNSDTDLAHLPRLAQIYKLYQERLISLNVADFGDLLLHNLTIFNNNADVLSYYQDKFRYILVDEYQDTNAIQYKWLLQLSERYKNLCAVGDDDQSIYSWRGAQITNILRFEKDFKGTKIVKLECNYRSTGNILKAASHLIRNNSQRHAKTLWTDGGKGDKIRLTTFHDERSEANNIALTIQNLHENSSKKLNDIAILVRAGYQTRAFEEAFIQNSLPYRIVGGLRFYERREIKDAIAYLRVIANFDDDLALTRIINLPKRGIGKVTLDRLFEKAKNERSSLHLAIKRSLEDGQIKGKGKEAMQELLNNLNKWQQLTANQDVSKLADDVLNESGYVEMWKNEKTPDAATRIENIKEFINGLEEFSDLKTFLEHVSLVGNKEEILQSDMVNIMTIHSAKGLEFDTVFIPGLEEGVFPNGRALDEMNGVEEERRLFYVAMTRAKKSLYLSFANHRVVFGSFQASFPSRFLKELPEDVLEGNVMDIANSAREAFDEHSQAFPKDQEIQTPSKRKSATDDFLNERVFHQKFGYGKVLEMEGDKLTISFEKTAGTKTVMKSFVQKA